MSSLKDRERFYAKVSHGPGCHEWQAAVNAHGYGLIGMDKRCKLAHRVAWEFANGPIPHGMCVLHRCDNPRWSTLNTCSSARRWITSVTATTSTVSRTATLTTCTGRAVSLGWVSGIYAPNLQILRLKKSARYTPA